MNNSQYPYKSKCNNSGSSRCLDCCVVLKTTHNLIRSDLLHLIRNNRNKFIDPIDLDIWLNDLYIKLNIKSEE